jgi:threonyl-tRNA synthetase
VQAAVLPITDAQNKYAAGLAARMRAAGLRVELDDSGEKIGKKIRNAEIAKTPVMLVVGAKEAEAESVALRRHGQGDLGVRPAAEVMEMLAAEVRERR